MRIALASDHAGFDLKGAVKKHLEAAGHEVQDLGIYSPERSDYPDQAALVAKAVQSGQVPFGILICGSAQGMAMAANRFKGVRAAVAPNREYAELARSHNDANILCLGQRLTQESEALAAVDVFLATPFEGGRHRERTNKMDLLG